MTRKDYVKFAEALKESQSLVHVHAEFNHGIRFVQHKIADIFAADNPRFDRERFYQACEPKERERLT